MPDNAAASAALRYQGLAASDGGSVVQRFGECVAAADGEAALQPLANPDRARIGGGIADRIFPVERLHSRKENSGRSAVRRFQNVQPRAFRAGVVKIQDQRGANLLLKVEIPDLHVAQAIVGIDPKIIA